MLDLSTVHTIDPDQAKLGNRVPAVARGGVLVVLDNASSADQVRPLLPTHPKNRSLITSRHLLGDLGRTRHLDLDVLEPTDAVALLAAALRAAWPRDSRVAADPVGTNELTELCGHLPLVLSIVAAMLNDDLHWPINELVDELWDELTTM